MNIILEKAIKEIESELSTYQRVTDYYKSRIKKLEKAKASIIDILKNDTTGLENEKR